MPDLYVCWRHHQHLYGENLLKLHEYRLSGSKGSLNSLELWSRKIDAHNTLIVRSQYSKSNLCLLAWIGNVDVSHPLIIYWIEPTMRSAKATNPPIIIKAFLRFFILHVTWGSRKPSKPTYFHTLSRSDAQNSTANPFPFTNPRSLLP